MQRSCVAMLLLPLLLSVAVPPAAAQPPVGDIISQVGNLIALSLCLALLPPDYWQNHMNCLGLCFLE